GPAAARRLHRPRHLPRRHAGAARGAGGFEIPSLPAPGEIRRSRLARPQDPARLLRLPRRAPCPDALIATRVTALGRRFRPAQVYSRGGIRPKSVLLSRVTLSASRRRHSAILA